jgi:PKD repeat protein
MKRIAIILSLLLPVFLQAGRLPENLPLVFNQNIQGDSLPSILLTAPDTSLRPEGKQPQPYRIAVGTEVNIDLAGEAKRFIHSSGREVMMLGIRMKGARGLILYFNEFFIPEGGKLYIYSRDRSHLTGAYTAESNRPGGYFAAEMVEGDEIIIEYDAPEGKPADPRISIYQVHFVYRDPATFLKGQSGPCEVNVNCPEGQAWQNEKRSVVKIVLKSGLGSYLCTGALVNNTRQDSTPYFLTARHCGSNASISDYSQWQFFFNYESLSCENPPEDPFSNKITGSTLLAEAPDDISSGSDFKLLLLSQKVPDSYNPFLAGWDRSGLPAQHGVGIHHPKGDIKKISTYTNPLVSTEYGVSASNPDGLYWKVVWAETESGHGVTEGGSSGSPIFNQNGRIVGTLTGGGASCNAPTAPDYYGKFSYHWSSNGSPGGAQLRPYLDPDNTGVTGIDGFGYGNLLSANFKADTTTISLGGKINFIDQSNGIPLEWEWSFPGAVPASFSGPYPTQIAYQDYGTYDVRLIVSNGQQSDTIVRKDYIRVIPNLYPNPAREYVILDFGNRELAYIAVTVFNLNGSFVKEFRNDEIVTGIYKVPVADLNAGNYIFRVKTNIMETPIPLIVF